MNRVIVATALLLFARPVLAQEDAEPFTVDYAAPAACPSAEAFFREVRGRTARARAARARESARALIVRIDASGERFAGRLAIDDAGATSNPREVEGATCAEVVGALALVAALAVDPHASFTPRPAPEASPAEEPTASALDGASVLDDPLPSEAKPVDRAAGKPPRFAVGLGVEVAAIAGAAASGRLLGEVVLGRGVVAPAVRVTFARSLDVDRAARIGAATLRWTTGGAELCPVRLVVGPSMDARPCAGVVAGVLDADGGGIASPQSRTRPWAAGDVHARLTWAVARALSLELEGGAMAPLFRESFFFEPDVPVYEAPAVAAFARAGAAMRFP